MLFVVGQLGRRNPEHLARDMRDQQVSQVAKTETLPLLPSEGLSTVPSRCDDTVPTNPDLVDPGTPLESLSLDWTERQLPERIRTKHVHRLHPYLGKYIPQLVEVFLRKYFSSGMTVLDPFSGSGTTMIQANELGVNGIGCDISLFNILIGSVKTRKYDLQLLTREVEYVVRELKCIFGPKHTLTPTHSRFSIIKDNDSEYLRTWYAPRALSELLTYRAITSDLEYRDFFRLVLSRAARSARLTTHFDLDFPKRPVTVPYECYKHGRMCSPTTTALKFLLRYSRDSLARVAEFAQLSTDATIKLVHGDSRTVQFPQVDGVITSPPYVGLIDYHEQHRYAYEILNLSDNQDYEIGPAKRGQSIAAKGAYVNDISSVLGNVASCIRQGGKLIIVAGDKFNLYPKILDIPGIVHDVTLKRHVNRRTGRRSTEFFESIFVCTKV